MLLTVKEKTRLEVVQAVMDSRMTVFDASHLLNLSVRQVYRLLASVRAQGIASVRHGHCGRVAWNRSDEKLWQRVIQLVRERYTDINDRHVQELLEREHSIPINHETLRRRLRAAGIAPKRKRRARKYRARRERRASAGMLLQINGSRHDWLEERGETLTLVGAKDDATGEVWALFAEAETGRAYFALMREIFLSEGLPLALYSDRHTIFHSPREPTIIEQLNNERPLTQFGRAMEELGVSLIKAYWPQAKGRIECQWGIFQDRLVVELRLASATTLAEANRVLKVFLRDYNPRFAVTAREGQKSWRTSPRAHRLDRILCLKETRQVGNDHTISFDGLVLQLPAPKKFFSLAKKQVTVLVLRDGGIEICYAGQTVGRYSQRQVLQLVEKYKRAKTRVA
jgi:transposase